MAMLSLSTGVLVLIHNLRDATQMEQLASEKHNGMRKRRVGGFSSTLLKSSSTILCQSFPFKFLSPQLTLKALCIAVITSPLAECCTVINCLLVEHAACHWRVIKVPSYHLDNNLAINENISQQSLIREEEEGYQLSKFSHVL